MSNPNNIKLADGVYLRLTCLHDTSELVYGLYSDGNSKPLLDYLDTKINSASDFSTTYFTKSSTIPRSKFREYGKNKDWKIVRDTEAASAIVIPDNYFYTDSINYYRTYVYMDMALAEDLLNPRSAFLAYIAENTTEFSTINKVILDNINRSLFQNQIQKINKISSGINQIQVYTDYRTKATFEMEWEILQSQGKFLIYQNPEGTVPVEKIEFLIKYKDKLVYDNALAAKLSDSIIGHAEFESLKAMVNSQQEDNLNLAVSVLTQSNYSQSLLYLALFLFKYNNRLIHTPRYNSKDYKGLRLYFHNYGDVKYWKLSTFAQIVKDHAHLMDEAFCNIMNNEMSTYVQERISGMEQYISIDNVTFKYA